MSKETSPPTSPPRDDPTLNSHPATVSKEITGTIVSNTEVLSTTERLNTAPMPVAATGAKSIGPTAVSQPVPSHVGRYRVIREIGRGGFGTVYLCRDELSDRHVAVKVPRPDRLNSARAVEAFLSEARHVSRLKHPGIVTLYDCGQADGVCYLVYEYIDGMNLLHRIRRGPMPFEEAALLVAQVADALHHAHSQNVFHRDIKPGNILLDKDGQPHVTDFGLAVREDELAGERGRRSGTLPYISPEQVRGEGHRIDGRTDIYSLGIVLYELLCGRLPFDRKSEDVLDQIQHRDPRPPRQINDSIPRELERICLKAASKQLAGRYATAKDMAEDLRLAVSPPPVAVASPGQTGQGTGPSAFSDQQSAIPRVVPKGLRSFGAEDSDFFLELLPGPRDRDGMPDSIRFWKTRIESRDPDRTFAVGLIYGPSGCGKSSLVKAGLLPRLGKSVVPIYVEAAREETESRLIKAVRKVYPGLEADLSLTDILMRLRRGDVPNHEEKILIVLDQFEQWLHTHGHEMEATDLFAALRQADGERVQVILMVRDDFWMGITRLFEQLEIDLDRERNIRPVDLFDLQHAQHVLLLLGQAYNRLPAHANELTAEQVSFLDRAVNELSEQNRVISVRLSLFAELMKERPWTLASLVEVGGTAGVGVRFLEEAFTARSALPDHRAYERPARAVLQALLPEPGVDIKGHLRSRAELADASGLAEHSHRFHRLIEILDRELHVITPTEVQDDLGTQPPARTPQPSLYQLTHDYLVPHLRSWLTLERRRKWRGRAELCLEERTAQMSRWPQSRYLPSLAEYLSIVFAMPGRRRKPDQRALMKQAARYHGARWGGALLAALVLGILIQQYVSAIRRTTRSQRTEALVNAILSAPADGVPYAIQNLTDVEDVAIPILRERLHDESLDWLLRLHAALTLAHFGEVESDFLLEAIAAAPAGECKNILTALGRAEESLKTALPNRFVQEQKPEAKVRYAATLLHLHDPAGAQLVLALEPDPSLRTAYVHGFADWHGDLTVLAQLLRQNDDTEFRSGQCAALGLIKPRSLDRPDREALQEVLEDFYRHGSDGATHSAAGWALRQWGVELPALPRQPHAPPSQHWFMNRHDMTMIEIKPGTFVMGEPGNQSPDSRPHEVTISERFFVCDREVSVALYRQFMNDTDYADKPQSWPKQGAVSPTDNCPAQTIDWFDAVQFCNWLSVKEGRAQCYRRTGAKEKIKSQFGEVECEVWECDWGADGYRLPTEAEWEYVCRGKSATAFHFADDVTLLRKYAVTESFGSSPGGSRLPNGWGLFDMHGNVAEWCWDRVQDYPDSPVTDPRGPSDGDKWILRGGAWTPPTDTCRSDNRMNAPPTTRNAMIGLRVVCR